MVGWHQNERFNKFNLEWSWCIGREWSDCLIDIHWRRHLWWGKKNSLRRRCAEWIDISHWIFRSKCLINLAFFTKLDKFTFTSLKTQYKFISSWWRSIIPDVFFCVLIFLLEVKVFLNCLLISNWPKGEAINWYVCQVSYNIEGSPSL